MKVVFGMFLGALLTVAVVFLYDTTSGRAVIPADGSTQAAADGRRPVVNWEVVVGDWRQFQLNMQALGEDIRRGWHKLAG